MTKKRLMMFSMVMAVVLATIIIFYPRMFGVSDSEPMFRAPLGEQPTPAESK